MLAYADVCPPAAKVTSIEMPGREHIGAIFTLTHDPQVHMLTYADIC
jgi:hypothetical protein